MGDGKGDPFSLFAAFLDTEAGRRFVFSRLPRVMRPQPVRHHQFDFKCSGKKGDIVEVSQTFERPCRGEKIIAGDSLDRPFVQPSDAWATIEREPRGSAASEAAWKIFREAQRAYSERRSATKFSVVIDGEPVRCWQNLKTTHCTAEAQALSSGVSFKIEREMKFVVEFAEDCEWSAWVLARILPR